MIKRYGIESRIKPDMIKPGYISCHLGVWGGRRWYSKEEERNQAIRALRKRSLVSSFFWNKFEYREMDR